MIVLLFGAPGCGKGTQAAFIASRFHIPCISTGEMFRAEYLAGTELGKLACSIISKGDLVGDEIVNPIVAGRIGQPDCASGFLLDGYPRTVPQAVFLDRMLAQRGLPQPTAIHLDVPAGVIVSRLTARRQCPACSRIYNMKSQPPAMPGICDGDGTALVRRDDDYEDVIRERLKAYRKATGPVLAHYAQRCRSVDANRAPEAIARDIEQILSGTHAAAELAAVLR